MVDERIAKFQKDALIRKRDSIRDAIRNALDANDKERANALTLEKIGIDKQIENVTI